MQEEEKKKETLMEATEAWIDDNWFALLILVLLFIFIAAVGYKPQSILPNVTNGNIIANSPAGYW